MWVCPGPGPLALHQRHNNPLPGWRARTHIGRPVAITGTLPKRCGAEKPDMQGMIATPGCPPRQWCGQHTPAATIVPSAPAPPWPRHATRASARVCDGCHGGSPLDLKPAIRDGPNDGWIGCHPFNPVYDMPCAGILAKLGRAHVDDREMCIIRNRLCRSAQKRRMVERLEQGVQVGQHTIEHKLRRVWVR